MTLNLNTILSTKKKLNLKYKKAVRFLVNTPSISFEKTGNILCNFRCEISKIIFIKAFSFSFFLKKIFFIFSKDIPVERKKKLNMLRFF